MDYEWDVRLEDSQLGKVLGLILLDREFLGWCWEMGLEVFP